MFVLAALYASRALVQFENPLGSEDGIQDISQPITNNINEDEADFTDL